MSDTCGAKKRDGSGEPCAQPAGWGTDHLGEGRCKLHGGLAGPPEDNKNAVTTGEHETILEDQLGEEERKLWEAVDTGHLAQVNKQIRTNKIRQRRMMQRIRRLKDEGVTLVERETKDGHVGDGPIDVTRELSRNALSRIQEIEDALTRVQKELRKLLREKYRILKDQPADNSDKLDELLGRMDSLREGASDYESPEM
jgi:uncharacterized protein YjcR